MKSNSHANNSAIQTQTVTNIVCLSRLSRHNSLPASNILPTPLQTLCFLATHRHIHQRVCLISFSTSFFQLLFFLKLFFFTKSHTTQLSITSFLLLKPFFSLQTFSSSNLSLHLIFLLFQSFLFQNIPPFTTSSLPLPPFSHNQSPAALCKRRPKNTQSVPIDHCQCLTASKKFHH